MSDTNNGFGRLAEVGKLEDFKITRNEYLEHIAFQVNIEQYFKHLGIAVPTVSEFGEFLDNLVLSNEVVNYSSSLFTNYEELLHTERRPFVKINEINYSDLQAVKFKIARNTRSDAFFHLISQDNADDVRLYLGATIIANMSKNDNRLFMHRIYEFTSIDFIYVGEKIFFTAILDIPRE